MNSGAAPYRDRILIHNTFENNSPKVPINRAPLSS
jgi:hypothetical protein